MRLSDRTGRGWPWLATAEKPRSGRYPGGSPCSRCGFASSFHLRCRYSRDGKSLATLGSNWTKIWDGGTGEYRFLIRGAGSGLDFTPDGARVAAAGDSGTVRFWDARQEQGALVHMAKESLYNASFSQDGRRILGALGTVLDAATGEVVGTIPAPSGQAIRETARYS